MRTTLSKSSYFSNIIGKDKKISDYTIAQAELYFDQQNQNRHISSLLSAISHFRDQTASEFQKQREKITPDWINTGILSPLENALKEYNNYQLAHPNNINATDALIFAKQAITERLKELESNHDKIYKFYSSHENSLKMFLNDNADNLNHKI